MLRELVKARTGPSAELEAVTAERDFFREKYAEQMDEMENMKGRLKESQRVIDRLRGQVLDLEVEKSGLVEQGGGAAKAPKQIESSGSSTSTSVTGLSSDDDLTAKSVVGIDAETPDEVADASAAGDNATSPKIVQEASEKESNPEENSSGGEDRSAPAPDEELGEDEGSSDEDDEDEGSGNEDEADNIRANAERMLLWATYQTSKSSRSPNTSMIQESADGLDNESKTETGSRYVTPLKTGVHDIVYSLPTSLDKRQGFLDDDSSLGSCSRHQPERSVGSWRSGAADTVNGGKIGSLFNNLRDMIDPRAESDSEEESDDEFPVR